MKKSGCLGTFNNSGLVAEEPCGLATAVFYATVDATEMILWDNNAVADGYELLHIYINIGTLVVTPNKPKACQIGIWFEIVKGAGGVTIDTEP